MKSTSLLALLPCLASCSPIEPRQQDTNSGIVTIKAMAGTGTAIADQPITASGGHFFVGKPTQAQKCPPDAGCAYSTNTTGIVVFSDGTASMGSMLYQQIFVNGTDGSLQYNPANSWNSKSGDSSNGFSFDKSPGMDQLGINYTNANGLTGFYACFAGQPNIFKVYTTEGAECLPFKMIGTPYRGGSFSAYSYS